MLDLGTAAGWRQFPAWLPAGWTDANLFEVLLAYWLLVFLFGVYRRRHFYAQVGRTTAFVVEHCPRVTKLTVRGGHHLWHETLRPLLVGYGGLLALYLLGANLAAPRAAATLAGLADCPDVLACFLVAAGAMLAIDLALAWPAPLPLDEEGLRADLALAERALRFLPEWITDISLIPDWQVRRTLEYFRGLMTVNLRLLTVQLVARLAALGLLLMGSLMC